MFVHQLVWSLAKDRFRNVDTVSPELRTVHSLGTEYHFSTVGWSLRCALPVRIVITTEISLRPLVRDAAVRRDFTLSEMFGTKKLGAVVGNHLALKTVALKLHSSTPYLWLTSSTRKAKPCDVPSFSACAPWARFSS